jgi:ferredoxin
LSHLDERRLGDLTVRIDRHLCVGFGDCLEVAPDVFEFDDEGIAVVREGAGPVGRELLIAACESCPVDALTLHDGTGEQLAPAR